MKELYYRRSYSPVVACDCRSLDHTFLAEVGRRCLQNVGRQILRWNTPEADVGHDVVLEVHLDVSHDKRG